MNRKQRRASGRRGAAPTLSPRERAAAGGRSPADLFGAAVAHQQAGNQAEAERGYRHLIALLPTHAEAHSRLGASLMGQGKADEAVSYLERAIALKPDLFEASANLAQAYLWMGQNARAMQAASRAVELRQTPQSKAVFVQCAKATRFTAYSDRYCEQMLRALAENWARPRELAASCVSLVKLDQTISDGIARVSSAWPKRVGAAELFGRSAISALAQQKLLHRILESGPVTDIGLERLLSNVRSIMLTAAVSGDTRNEVPLEFCCSLARQCFINEFIFSTSDGELDQVQQLRVLVEQALTNNGSCPSLSLAAIGAYVPLHTLAHATALLDRPWPDCVKALLVQQIAEPMQERRIAASIPVITDIDGEVTHAVRRQYEESPYPRWVRSGPAEQPPLLADRAGKPLVDVLIAGCGTGLSTIEFAQNARDARILAVDLSRASLAYAKRMADEIGLGNVEFAQADIMRLAASGRSFDCIDASGVLHHLADPWQGWRILLSLLRPGGVMQLGFYSEMARRNIVAARARIAQRGYQPTPQDIRRCREDILASADPLLKSVVQWEDFFTTSECRDLLFHVQEYRVSLPEIKSFLAANGMQFAGFNLDPATLHRFAARFPTRTALTDLDCWHAFETEAPNTFANMYQFWIARPAARLQATVAEGE